MEDNPYESPIHRADAKPTGRRRALSIGCFWLAMAFATVGLISVFNRNSPPLGWFLLASFFFIGGVFVPRKSYRIAAIVGCVLCLLASAGTLITHYERHLEWQKQQRFQELQRVQRQR